jgi:Beta-galactosidase
LWQSFTHLLLVWSLFAWGIRPLSAKVVVFWQEGFPTVDSQPISRATLERALGPEDAVFLGIEGLQDPSALANADLLVLPYGSAFPTAGWSAIFGYLEGGGNLLTLGGQPFRVPVTGSSGSFQQLRPQDTYSIEVGIRHNYEIPVAATAKFAWKDGYHFLASTAIQGHRFFALEGQFTGLGYMVDPDGTKSAAPVVVGERIGASRGPSPGPAPHMVMLDFEPNAGYWESTDGIALVGQAADYARQGAIRFWIETLYSAIRPHESAEIQIHIENAPAAQPGDVKIEISSADSVLYNTSIPCTGSRLDASVPFHKPLPTGFYTIRGVYEYGGKPREYFRSGFWVQNPEAVDAGPTLSVRGDFLIKDGTPFFPFGTNYFTTEENGWDFSGPRNAAAWDSDFADMERHGVTFVRTGVWMSNAKFVEPSTGQVSERFLRNLEAYLTSARNHHIAINFTFYSFTPKTGSIFPVRQDQPEPPLPNPYTNAAIVREEQTYMLSIVNRFKNVPWLSWDLINEPSFSNPRRIFAGNTPNGDPTEVAAWRKWLREKYGNIDALASAWGVPPQRLKTFENVDLPAAADLHLDRYGNSQEVRALDYNLFAQDAFTEWVQEMVTAIRSTGSKQLVDVGQDEGGVQNRVLNQFFVKGGVSFTVNHTYRADDALLWDSLVAKRPGTPNFVGETGYQPVWWPDGTWRYDELSAFALQEKKLAFGFAAGSSGALQWDWAREVDFGMQRSDGSAKTWQAMMRDMGDFAKAASSWATELVEPQVALVLPQSLQLSVFNATALDAQQAAVRALYHYGRAEAYAVGEYQIDGLGSPRLIILPSPYVLTSEAWDAIVDKVKAGSVLLVSGPFDEDAHFHPTGRQDPIGLSYTDAPLLIHENHTEWAGGKFSLVYSGMKITILNRAVLPNGQSWKEVSVGKGKILFSPLPLELNDNIEAVGDVYRYALRAASVSPTYVTDLQDPGILIAPTQFPHATLYLLSSESNQDAVSFTDKKSGKRVTGELSPGRTALLLIGEDGKELASYNWRGH